MLKSVLKRQFSRYTTTGKRVSSKQRKIFLEKELFKSAKSLELYSMKGLNSMRMTSLGLFGFGSYHLYSYNFGKYQEYDRFSNVLFGSLSALGLVWMSYRSGRTLKALTILDDGTSLLLKRCSWFGFREKEALISNHNMKGITHFAHQGLKMPMVVFKSVIGEKTELFFKTDGMVHEEAFRSAISGYAFDIAPRAMHGKLSKKKMKNYGGK